MSWEIWRQRLLAVVKLVHRVTSIIIENLNSPDNHTNASLGVVKKHTDQLLMSLEAPGISVEKATVKHILPHVREHSAAFLQRSIGVLLIHLDPVSGILENTQSLHSIMNEMESIEKMYENTMLTLPHSNQMTAFEFQILNKLTDLLRLSQKPNPGEFHEGCTHSSRSECLRAVHKRGLIFGNIGTARYLFWMGNELHQGEIDHLQDIMRGILGLVASSLQIPASVIREEHPLKIDEKSDILKVTTRLQPYWNSEYDKRADANIQYWMLCLEIHAVIRYMDVLPNAGNKIRPSAPDFQEEVGIYPSLV